MPPRHYYHCVAGRGDFCAEKPCSTQCKAKKKFAVIQILVESTSKCKIISKV